MFFISYVVLILCRLINCLDFSDSMSGSLFIFVFLLISSFVFCFLSCLVFTVSFVCLYVFFFFLCFMFFFKGRSLFVLFFDCFVFIIVVLVMDVEWCGSSFFFYVLIFVSFLIFCF